MLSTPPLQEDAFMVAVHLRRVAKYEYWENGKAASAAVLNPGETIIYDIKRKPTFLQNHLFHSVHFYLPRAALDALADDANAPRIGELRYRPAVSHQDPILKGITESLMPAFRNPHRVNYLYMDHVMLAAGHHIASRYGEMRSIRYPASRGLSLGQESRAKALLAENLSGNLPLTVLARECNLSPSQFSKAFRKTVGVPPHRWVIHQRIALAKTLLRDGRLPLAEIAVTCGFSDQSHFTRSFSVAVGFSPGAWRRAVQI
jgi:AraC family transcriptional regulator